MIESVSIFDNGGIYRFRASERKCFIAAMLEGKLKEMGPKINPSLCKGVYVFLYH